MRFPSLLFGLSCLALAACAAPPLEEPAPGLVPAWRGTFEGSCSPGEMVIFLDERDGESFGGTMYFETAKDHGRITYNIAASLEGGVLRVKQTEIEAADPIPGHTICTGQYELALGNDGEEDAMAGSYAPTNCGCNGSVSLAPFE
jgi:hypothetical protein